MVSRMKFIVLGAFLLLQSCQFSYQEVPSESMSKRADEESMYWILPGSQEVDEDQVPVVENDDLDDYVDDETATPVEDVSDEGDMLRETRKFTLARVRRDPQMA